MHFGFDSGPFVAEADLIVVIESDAPWYPSMQQPAPGCRVVHIGEDPAFVRYPMRSFPADLSITARADYGLAALEAAVARRIGADDDARCGAPRRALRHATPRGAGGPRSRPRPAASTSRCRISAAPSARRSGPTPSSSTNIR